MFPVYSDQHCASWLYLLKLFYIQPPVGIWVHDSYLNHALETFELCEIWKLNIYI